MAQSHLDRLTSIDASFLHNERGAAHMHIGAVTLFEGPPPRIDDVLDHIRGRLHLVPRYRQHLVVPPLETGRPLWADDPQFNLEYHVRHTALPAPGEEEQLLELAARIFSQRLDRSKPLWEMWVVEGLERNRFALIQKTHHALVDGIAGVDIAQVLFDLNPVPAEIEPPSDAAWEPAPTPSPADVVTAGLRGMTGAWLKLANRALDAVAHPEHAIDSAREAVQGVSEIAWAGLNPAPETPLNVEIGPHRRLAVVRNDLADYKAIKNSLGGTVNDVVLTVVAGALRGWLQSPAASVPRGSSCVVWSRSRSAAGTTADSSATASQLCVGRCRSTSATRSRGCASCARRWTGSRSPSRPWARKCCRASRTSPHRRSSPRPLD